MACRAKKTVVHGIRGGGPSSAALLPPPKRAKRGDTSRLSREEANKQGLYNRCTWRGCGRWFPNAGALQRHKTVHNPKDAINGMALAGLAASAGAAASGGAETTDEWRQRVREAMDGVEVDAVLDELPALPGAPPNASSRRYRATGIPRTIPHCLHHAPRSSRCRAHGPTVPPCPGSPLLTAPLP